MVHVVPVDVDLRLKQLRAVPFLEMSANQKGALVPELDLVKPGHPRAHSEDVAVRVLVKRGITR